MPSYPRTRRQSKRVSRRRKHSHRTSRRVRRSQRRKYRSAVEKQPLAEFVQDTAQTNAHANPIPSLGSHAAEAEAMPLKYATRPNISQHHWKMIAFQSYAKWYDTRNSVDLLTAVLCFGKLYDEDAVKFYSHLNMKEIQNLKY